MTPLLWFLLGQLVGVASVMIGFYIGARFTRRKMFRGGIREAANEFARRNGNVELISAEKWKGGGRC